MNEIPAFFLSKKLIILIFPLLCAFIFSLFLLYTLFHINVQPTHSMVQQYVNKSMYIDYKLYFFPIVRSNTTYVCLFFVSRSILKLLAILLLCLHMKLNLEDKHIQLVQSISVDLGACGAKLVFPSIQNINKILLKPFSPFGSVDKSILNHLHSAIATYFIFTIFV